MKEEKIKVLALLPMELPKEIDLDNTLEAMQNFVGGLIECIAFVLNLTIVIGLIGGYGSPRRALYTITDELMNSAYRFKRGW